MDLGDKTQLTNADSNLNSQKSCYQLSQGPMSGVSSTGRQVGNEKKTLRNRKRRKTGSRIHCRDQNLGKAAAIHHTGVDLSLQHEDQETEEG